MRSCAAPDELHKLRIALAGGKWFTQSPVNDAGNLISNVGSAYVILALQACGELPGWPFSVTKYGSP